MKKLPISRSLSDQYTPYITFVLHVPFTPQADILPQFSGLYNPHGFFYNKPVAINTLKWQNLPISGDQYTPYNTFVLHVPPTLQADIMPQFYELINPHSWFLKIKL